MKKTGNPLFKLNKLSIKEMVENLEVLYGKRGDQITADIEDVRDVLDLMEGKSDEEGVGESVKYTKDQVVVFKVENKLGIGQEY